MKTLYLVLGNGFTMDLINILKKEEQIDVRNLFRFGNCVPWPGDGEPSFLSLKRCENLWTLGARANMDTQSCMSLIENIITCANMYSQVEFHTKNNGDTGIFRKIDDTYIKNGVYIKAYKELTYYMKHLFIYYNQQITDEEFNNDAIKSWGWYKYFIKLKEKMEYDKVIIVTYNYDIWLERLLKLLDIDFSIAGIETEEKKVVIVKPHGSISFLKKNVAEGSEFSINYQLILPEANIGEFEVVYEDLAQNSLLDAIIPPAGEAGRLNDSWATQLRKFAIGRAKLLKPGDDVMMCGISYWHVDRKEIDEILTSMDPTINVKLVNPRPAGTLDAVLSSLFKNYVVYSNSKILGGE